jgi:hypothetical protein
MPLLKIQKVSPHKSDLWGDTLCAMTVPLRQVEVSQYGLAFETAPHLLVHDPRGEVASLLAYFPTASSSSQGGRRLMIPTGSARYYCRRSPR